MTGVMEHYDDKCVEICDDEGYGALRLQQSWSIIMTGAMEHCGSKGHGAL